MVAKKRALSVGSAGVDTAFNKKFPPKGEEIFPFPFSSSPHTYFPLFLYFVQLTLMGQL
jgi:hypothetical protein